MYIIENGVAPFGVQNDAYSSELNRNCVTSGTNYTSPYNSGYSCAAKVLKKIDY